MGIRDRIGKMFLRKSLDNAPLPPTWPSNWFQLGARPPQLTSGGSVIEACMAAYAKTVAQLPGRHFRIDEQGVKSYLPTSALSDALHKPNNYQTRSDFFLNVVYQLLEHGNAYIVTSENREHMFMLDARMTQPQRSAETGDVFYSTGGAFAEMMDVDGTVMIPERYVGHLRLHTPYDPLIGVTPIQAAAASVAANNAITGHQATFFTNMSRPSGVLTTELDLTKDQMVMLREAWNEQSKSLNSGGVPILANGLKWNSMSLSNQDAEMVAALKFTVEDISRVFGVPLMMINSMENATFDNAETLMRYWMATGLGFLVNHIEVCIADLYRLPKQQGVELDTEVLLRSDLQARMEAMGVGVTKGIYSPNEARQKEGLPPVKGGEMPRVQQQMVPLDWEEPEPAPPALPAPEPEPEDKGLVTIKGLNDPVTVLYALADEFITERMDDAA